MSSNQAGTGDWSPARVAQRAALICDPAVLHDRLQQGAQASLEQVQDVLSQARAGEGLNSAQAALLLQVADPQARESVLEAAGGVHQRYWGSRVSLLAPLCPTNRCVNDCPYCPLRRSNARLRRAATNTRDLQREVVALLDEGYRHVTLVFGDDRSGVPYLRDMIWATLGTRSGLRQVQRVDLNLNPLRVSELRELSEAARLGTYQVFQETYDREVYARLHPDGPKADYDWRITGHDRAREAGLEHVGLGVLLGTGDWRFDVLACLTHAEYLNETYGLGPQSIGFPRMIPTPGAPASEAQDRQPCEEDFLLAVAVSRLARPCVDLVLLTPAAGELRRKLYALGVSQVSVGSSSYPGVYTEEGNPGAGGTLTIGRPRALEELVYRMAEVGFVPNFCVACYASRPGRRSPDTDPCGCVEARCRPNALLALKEYLLDHASAETQALGDRVIQQQLARLPHELREQTLEFLEEVESGLRRQVL